MGASLVMTVPGASSKLSARDTRIPFAPASRDSYHGITTLPMISIRRTAAFYRAALNPPRFRTAALPSVCASFPRSSSRWFGRL